MTCLDLSSLPWLLPAPEDYRARVRALAAEKEPDGAEIRALATYALDLNQCHSLARQCIKLKDRINSKGVLSPLRFAFLSNGTNELVAPAIIAGALRHGVIADFYAPGYGQALNDILSPDSKLAAHHPDVVLLAFDHRGYGLTHPEIGVASADETIARAREQLNMMVSRLRASGTQIIIQTIPQPPEPWGGHSDAILGGSIRTQIRRMNDEIRDLCAEQRLVLLDAAALAAQVGTQRWFSPRFWNEAKLPFDPDIAPLYGDHVGRLLGALRGKSRKALVLDLDNTLWGGVIGDDGLSGIQIGQGSPEGEAFLSVQRLALQLKARGIVLAICSKNEEKTAREPFHMLDEMLIREDDIAVFVANWTDKASNINYIAQTLNIGTDALVFLDDNPAERARVRQVLPEVAVPELPEDPALYAMVLANAGYFETIGLSEDDTKRADQYRANAARTQTMQEIGDLGTYYKSLEMVCSISRFDANGQARIVQLINKTNQFNLTTRRYTALEIERAQQDETVLDLQVRLTDRFGDNGMISVVMFRSKGDTWVCDTWLMSCRVLERRVEEAVLNVIVRAAQNAGVKRLQGLFIPSARNMIVSGFWEKLGFTRTGEKDDGTTIWELVLEGYSPVEVPMELLCDFDTLSDMTP